MMLVTVVLVLGFFSTYDCLPYVYQWYQKEPFPPFMSPEYTHVGLKRSGEK